MESKLEFPSALMYQGRAITLAGKGRAPGSMMYYDSLRGRFIETFVAEVVITGNAYSVAAVKDNNQFARLRVDHDAIVNGGKPGIGTTLLLAGVDLSHEPRIARYAWRIASAAAIKHNGYMAAKAGNDLNKPTPPPGRSLGTVIFTHQSGSWCKASRDADGEEFYIHLTQWRPKDSMQMGQRVSFVPARTERGLSGYDVRLAA